MNFCLWITGLPGSGKSTIAREVEELLSNSGIETIILSMDQIRTIITPEPAYTDQERDIVYRSLVMMAKLLVEHSGKGVIIDATGNRRSFRGLARELIPEFAEIYVSCPVEVCQAREPLRQSREIQPDLYKKAKQGRLEGGLPGVSAPYEEPESPELKVQSDVLTPRESATKITNYVKSRWLLRND
ncbi:MAG: adenylyl-sulfate kinase [Thermodesulfobacteriota bacterium]